MLACRPETAPGATAWLGTSASIQQAIRMMDCFAREELSIKGLAAKLDIGERWLRELFQKQVGASPQAILMSKKLDIARNLLDKSSLSITEIAFSSRFQSIRRFNDAFKDRFQKTPSTFRTNPLAPKQLRLQLRYRPPYAWSAMLNYFNNRTISKVELTQDNSYQRLITHGDIRGWLKVTNTPNNKVEVEFKLNKSANIMEFAARVKNIFDLDCDPMAIENRLKEDKQLNTFLLQQSGLRIPGCWDGFELAVRAIVGQKISVKAARTILGRIVENCGEKQMLDSSLPLERFFPTAENMLAADLSKIGLTQLKIESLKSLAQEIANKNLILDGTADFAETCRKLHSIKGIGAWTVEYISMRALRNPDGFPETDLEIQKKALRLQLNPQIGHPGELMEPSCYGTYNWKIHYERNTLASIFTQRICL